MIKRIQNLKISFKLYILVGVALIGMLIIGGMSFNLMGKLNEKTSDKRRYGKGYDRYALQYQTQ